MASLASDDTSLKVGQGIHFFPPAESDAIDPSHPTVILVFGWMAAKFSHLLKYSSIYRKRYPNTTLVLTQCEPSFFWSGKHAQRKSLTPLADILEALGLIYPSLQPSTSHKSIPLDSVVPLPVHQVLVHAFSNGGCCQLMTLRDIIANRRTSSPTTPIFSASALILDSCPGDESFSSAERAFTISVSNPLLRILIKLSVIILFTFRLFMRHVFRQKPIISSMRSQLNDPDILPWAKKNSPRVYIYSEGDEMVLAKAVEQHIGDAIEKGFNVHSVKFGKESKHVAHARTNPSRYWGAIEDTWKAAIEEQD